jgi:hypothetical protein
MHMYCVIHTEYIYTHTYIIRTSKKTIQKDILIQTINKLVWNQKECITAICM